MLRDRIKRLELLASADNGHVDKEPEDELRTRLVKIIAVHLETSEFICQMWRCETAGDREGATGYRASLNSWFEGKAQKYLDSGQPDDEEAFLTFLETEIHIQGGVNRS